MSIYSNTICWKDKQGYKTFKICFNILLFMTINVKLYFFEVGFISDYSFGEGFGP